MARQYARKRAIAVGPGRKPKDDYGLVEIIRIAVKCGNDLNEIIRRFGNLVAQEENIAPKSARERLSRAYRNRYANEAGE